MQTFTRYAAPISVAAVAWIMAMSGMATADSHTGLADGPTIAANPRAGIQENRLSSGFSETSVAWGALALANPDTVAGVTNYGYNTANGGPLTQNAHEAFKTEPDKNVYLTFAGHHYLYQGHEGGPRGYVTRVDLDQNDPAQKVSLVSDKDADGKALPTFDGITWDPFSHQLLLTAESKYPTGGVWAVKLDSVGNATNGLATRVASIGSGGFEGIQNDSDGNVWLVEDVGGAAAGDNGKGKVPNSYIYRFRPSKKSDLTAGGTLEALRVYSSPGVSVSAAQLAANPADPFVDALHDLDNTFKTDGVVVHSGSVGTDVAGYNATTSAATAGATPFKRPENGVFRPGTNFKQFYFTETGDTNADSHLPGAYGGVFALSQSSPSASSGTIKPVVVGDIEHTGFDNITFASHDDLLVVEDAGDGLHQQRNALDSAYVVDLSNTDEGAPLTRFLAEGRDSSATYDALSSPGYNDGDNEITGIHVSNGDPSAAGILGAKVPTLFDRGWRLFWTQQHGDNVTWEITR